MRKKKKKYFEKLKLKRHFQFQIEIEMFEVAQRYHRPQCTWPQRNVATI